MFTITVPVYPSLTGLMGLRSGLCVGHTELIQPGLYGPCFVAWSSHAERENDLFQTVPTKLQ